jgi:crossover junction endodeoxyribonuclease RusA
MAENKIKDLPPIDWDATHRYGTGSVPPGCEPVGGEALSVWVAGEPAPQGSKRAFGAGRPGGKIRMVEMSKKVGPWRDAVKAAFKARGHRGVVATATGLPPGWPLLGPVVVKLVFVMPRPQAQRKATKPMVERPDLDKLIRSTLDAIGMAGVWSDDSQVITVHAHKRRAEIGEDTGAMIHIEPVPADLVDSFSPRAKVRSGTCRCGHFAGSHLATRCYSPGCLCSGYGAAATHRVPK